LCFVGTILAPGAFVGIERSKAMMETEKIPTDIWLKVMCALMINAVLFGVGVITVLSVPTFADQAKYLIPVVIVASFAITPFLCGFIARRMRIRNCATDAAAEKAFKPFPDAFGFG